MFWSKVAAQRRRAPGDEERQGSVLDVVRLWFRGVRDGKTRLLRLRGRRLPATGLRLWEYPLYRGRRGLSRFTYLLQPEYLGGGPKYPGHGTCFFLPARSTAVRRAEAGTTSPGKGVARGERLVCSAVQCSADRYWQVEVMVMMVHAVRPVPSSTCAEDHNGALHR